MWNLINKTFIKNRLTTVRGKGGCWDLWKRWRDQAKSKPTNQPKNPLRCRRYHGDYQRERGGQGVRGGRRGCRGINSEGGDLTWVGEYTIYRWCIIELYSWNLYNFNQLHPNELNRKVKSFLKSTLNDLKNGGGEDTQLESELHQILRVGQHILTECLHLRGDTAMNKTVSQ